LLRENGVDHGEHAPHLLYDSLRDVLGPAILPSPLPAPSKSKSKGQGQGQGHGQSKPSRGSPGLGPGPEDEARLRRVGQEWSIPPEEIAKRCVACVLGWLVGGLVGWYVVHVVLLLVRGYGSRRRVCLARLATHSIQTMW
jgi:hypothetical protein